MKQLFNRKPVVIMDDRQRVLVEVPNKRKALAWIKERSYMIGCWNYDKTVVYVG